MPPVDDVAECASSSSWGRFEPFVSRSRDWLRSAAGGLVEGFYRHGGWRRHTSAHPSQLLDARAVRVLGLEYGSLSSDELEHVLRDLVWLTYRSDFPPLLSSHHRSVTTDCGWGCMLRAAQMMVARALTRSTERESSHRIVQHFEDTPQSALGIHTLIGLAKQRFDWREPVGRWYTPSETILLLREALLLARQDPQSHSTSLQLNIYLPLDNAVIPGEITASSNGWSRSVLVVVPLRLGTKHINPVYYPKLKAAFTLPSVVGILGGRPQHALYLIGHADDVGDASFRAIDKAITVQNFFGLDPHTTQQYRPLETLDAGDSHWDTFRTTTPTVIAVNRMDPSCAMGFLVRNEHEHAEWRRAMVELGLAVDDSHTGGSMHSSTPLFTIMEKRAELASEREHDLCKKNPSLGDFEIL